jgi:hypothetical protein
MPLSYGHNRLFFMGIPRSVALRADPWSGITITLAPCRTGRVNPSSLAGTSSRCYPSPVPHRRSIPHRAASLALSTTLVLLAAASRAEHAGAPVLIELFTAEGCSSCPPADHFLAELDAAQPIPGARLIVLSEHVDYWDQQGWPDPYASKAFTERQAAYDRNLRIREPFTPQFIVDGAIDMRLSRRDHIAEQLRAAATAAKIPVSIESISIGSGTTPVISGVVRVEGVTGDRPCDVFVAVALDHADTQVLRGENRGQHLTHVAVLRELVRVGPVAPGAASRQPFSLELRPGLQGTALRVIAFVQRPGSGAVIGVAEQSTGS